MLLPQKLGPLTLMRKLGSDGATESFAGILDEPAGQAVVAHRLPTSVTRDAVRYPAVTARVRDLTGVRHPLLVPVRSLIEDDGETYVIEEQPDSVDMGTVLDWCRREGRELPPNLYLHLATQLCNALEALHGRPGKASGTDAVLHLALRPAAVQVSADGQLSLGGYDLGVPIAASDERALTRIAAFAPEQTQADPTLSPATDIFSLGSTLYEMLTLESLFRGDSGLQTLHAVRKAEVSAALQKVKRAMPGLDKVLYRALSLNARHRYQRAFVLREDIRGLMAGYSFTRITEDLAEFLAPIFAEAAKRAGPALPADDTHDSTGALLRTAAIGGAASDLPSGRARGARETLAPVDDLDGLEMWSEVPTSVDPSDPAIGPTTTPSPAARRDPSVPLDQTSWIRRDLDRPPTDAFDGDEATDISTAAGGTPPPALRSPPTLTPDFGAVPTKRQLTPAEAADLGLRQRRPPSTPVRVDPTSTNVPVDARREDSAPTTRESVVGAPDREERARIAAEAARRASRDAEDKRRSAPPPPPRRDEPSPELTAPRGADPAPPPPPADDDEDLEWRPNRSGRTALYVGAGVGVFALLLLCGGGAIWGAVEVGRQLATRPFAAGPTEPQVGDVLPTATEFPEFPEEPEPPAASPPADAPAAAPPAPAPSVAAVVPPPAAAPPVAPTTARSTEPARAPAPTRADPTTAPSRAAAPTRPAAPVTTAAPTPATSPIASTGPTRTTTRAPSPPADTVARLAPPTTRLPADDLFGAAPLTETAITSAPPEIDSLSGKARQGNLSAADRLTLEMVDRSDVAYTRAQTLLYEDAKARGDGRNQRKHLDAILAHPENRYSPVFLAEGAHLDIADKRYDRALQRAETAERHWARLPSDLVFSRKAMIYEAQAAAWQGMFYTSGGEDRNALTRSILAWERYQKHVGVKNRTDMARLADEQLAKLYDARRRLE